MRAEDVLGGEAVEEALAEGVEEVGSLDVFLAIERGHGWGSFGALNGVDNSRIRGGGCGRKQGLSPRR